MFEGTGEVFQYEQSIVYSKIVSLPKVLTDIELFPSIRDAKRNGWDKPILDGFNKYVVGKLKTRIYITKITETDCIDNNFCSEIRDEFNEGALEEKIEIINGVKNVLNLICICYAQNRKINIKLE